jgi:glycosyltransferase involved in cell wall biosynthesis
MKWLVLIPAHNEAESLARVVDDLHRYYPDLPILVVDDGSTDQTPALLRTLPVFSLRLTHRLGLGRALRAGFRYARILGHDAVIRFDGDGQHQADQIAALQQPILAGDAEVTIGSRHPRAAAQKGFRFRTRQALAVCLSAITGWPVSDPTSGFWAFGPRAVDLLSDHHPSGYPEPELLLFLHRNAFRVSEVAIVMRDRLAGRTSLTLSRQWLAFLRTVLALVVVPLRRTVSN